MGINSDHRMGIAIKKLTILGSTGSIGQNALKVVDSHPDRFQIIGLSANTNLELLIEQAQKYQPQIACIVDSGKHTELQDALREYATEVVSGRSALLELAANDHADLLLNAIVGSAGMEPTIQALKNNVDVALSNKESLVMAGNIINDLLREYNVSLFPVDSEHSAIWQCMRGETYDDVSRIILTGSGGPFRELSKEELRHVTKEQALNHPNWSMGKKITIDSATMANKGLEVIEAYWLFHVPHESIDVVIHPQSIVHSMIEFADGSVKAQLGLPDMKIPIQYALLYPEHAPPSWERLDLTEIQSLTFESPDYEKFTCLKLAIEALKAGGIYPAVFNLANELAVEQFLSDNIAFHEIPRIISTALEHSENIPYPDLDDIIAAERWIYNHVKPHLI